jgi:trk system potassium uptake protein TrkH
MRLPVICHFQGLMALLIAGSMLFPLGVSLAYGESDAPAFAIAIVVTALAGLALRLPLRGRVQYVSRRESFAIVTLGWILASAFGALPFVLAGTFASYVDAYFEAISGFTTTGASVLTHIEAQPRGILFWRDFTQWLGGMGIIVLFVAIMPILGVGAAQMFELEAPGPITERLTPRIRDQAKSLWLIYVAISALEAVLLKLRGLSLFDSLTHVFGTMATGGYSPRNVSVGAYGDPVVEYIITIFMAAAGVNFGLYYLLWHGRGVRVLMDREFRLYVAIIGSATTLVLLDLVFHAGQTIGDAFRFALFQVVSIQTTTGFATADFNLWPPLSQGILVGLMFVGASAGSTGGAMKVIRLWVLVKFAHREIFAMFNPRAVVPLKRAGKPIPDKVVSETVGFSILYMVLLAAATLFVASFGYDLVTSLTSVAATLGNVGPGLGLVGPMANYAELPDAVKIVLSFCMLAGRLEIWTVFVLLRPAFWARR